MGLALGTANRLAYAKEASWKDAATAAAKYITVRKLAGAGLKLDRTSIQTQEMNNRRAVTGLRLGTRQASATVPTELFYGGVAATDAVAQFDDFMESWFCNAWTAATAAIAAQTVTVGTPAASGTTLTCGTAATGLALGDWIKVSGYTGAQAGNNGYYKIINVNSLILTVASPNYATMVAGAAQGTAVAIQKMAYIIPSTTTKSLVFEERDSDESAVVLAKYELGCIANTFSLNITPDSIITCDFGFVGGSFGTGATVAAAATAAGLTAPCGTPGAANTTDPMTANDSLMYLMLDNVAVAVVTNLKVDGNNNFEAMYPIGALNAYAIGKGDSMMSGTFDVFMLDNTFWTKYEAETTLSLSIRMMDPNGIAGTTMTAKGYAFDIPNVKINSLGDTKEKTKIMYNVGWTAIENATASAAGGVTVNARLSRLV